MKQYSYKTIVEELDKKCLPYILCSSEKDFENEKDIQSKSGLYVKLHFKCVECGSDIYKSMACIYSSRHFNLCNSCAQRFGAQNLQNNYDEIINELLKKGFVPLFNTNEIKNMNTTVQCIGTCGHIIKTSLDAFCRRKTSLCGKCARHIHDGENNYNWKGGYNNERDVFRKTYECKRFTREVLKRDHYKCVVCGKSFKEVKINIHHKDGYNWCKEKRTNIDNGVVLCEECHKKFHSRYGRGNNTKEQFEEWLNINID